MSKKPHVIEIEIEDLTNKEALYCLRHLVEYARRLKNRCLRERKREQRGRNAEQATE